MIKINVKYIKIIVHTTLDIIYNIIQYPQLQAVRKWNIQSKLMHPKYTIKQPLFTVSVCTYEVHYPVKSAYHTITLCSIIYYDVHYATSTSLSLFGYMLNRLNELFAVCG